MLLNYTKSDNLGKPITFTQESYNQFLLTTIKNITYEGNNIGFLAISENANEIRAAINKINTDDDYRNTLIKDGLINARKYHPEKVTRMFEELYDRI